MSQTVSFPDDAYVIFPSGKVSVKALDAIFQTMPYELDYLDRDDHYRWYSPNPWRDDDRLQQRLNHHVFGCHPQRVVPLVKQVLTRLKSGQQDVVESPQVMDGHRTLIRYYAIRDRNHDYLGTLQVTEDVEHICRLCEQDTFAHGIVEGKIVDGITTASINDHSVNKQRDQPDGTTSPSRH